MRVRLSGKRYDTEAASLLFSWSNRKDRNDLYFESFGVYVKTTGECFIHGFGGAATAWGFEDKSGSASFGEGIFPIGKWAVAMIGEALRQKKAVNFYRLSVFQPEFQGSRVEQEEDGHIVVFVGAASRFAPAVENSGCKVG